MTDYIDLPQLPTGRALFALEQMRAKLADTPVLIAQPDAAQAAVQALRDLESRRAAAVATQRSGTRGEAQRIDRELDRALAEMVQLANALARLGDAHPQGAAAASLLQRFFPNGVGPVIHVAYEEQLRLMEAMLAAIKEAPAAEWIAVLPFEPYLATLRALTPQYRAELEKPPPEIVPFAKVRAERRIAHRELELLVAGVHFLLRDDARAALAPLAQQIERHRALRKGRRHPQVDVDPQTGAEVGPADSTG